MTTTVLVAFHVTVDNPEDSVRKWLNHACDESTSLPFEGLDVLTHDQTDAIVNAVTRLIGINDEC